MGKFWTKTTDGFWELVNAGKKIPDAPVYPFDMTAILDSVLRFGLYPATLSHPQDDIYLKNLANSVVIRDLLNLSLVDHPTEAMNLLILLAYQIGSLVNYTELSSKLGIDIKTVQRYIALFEQSFVLFRLLPYSQRKRSEIGKMPKIYFYDVGLRNALIENFVISEVVKANSYGRYGYHLNFWRTKTGSEVDLVLTTTDGTLIGIEIKSTKKAINLAFRNRYPHAKTYTITPQNFYAHTI